MTQDFRATASDFWHYLNPQALTPPTKDELAATLKYLQDTDKEVAQAIIAEQKLKRSPE